MRAVLVTGARGFIGRYVCEELEARGITYRAFDLPAHDVCDRNALLDVIALYDGIINLAGVLGTEELFGSEYRAAQVNVLGALNVFDVAAERNIPVVQVATGHKGQPNPYAITKGCAEDLALARACWLGQKIAVVRAYHAYGAGQPPPPPWGKGHAAKIVPVFACRTIQGKPLPLHGGGTQVVDMVHASSVARCLVDALGGPYGHVIDAGTGRGITVRRVAEDIVLTAAANTANMALHVVPPRRGEPPEAVVVAANPAVPAAEGWPWLLSETVDYYRGLLGAAGGRARAIQSCAPSAP